MLITCLPAAGYHPIAFQCSEKCLIGPVNQFEVIDRATPGVKKDHLGFDLFNRISLLKHLLKVIVFGLSIGVGVVDSIVDRHKVALVSG